MDALSGNFIPWRERAFVTVAEAAAIFARSTTWVRNRLTDGSLDTARELPNGPTAITVTSVLALIEITAPKEEPAAPRRHAKTRRPYLRLVVNNDL